MQLMPIFLFMQLCKRKGIFFVNDAHPRSPCNLAQMVERSLSMLEVSGSMPGFSIYIYIYIYILNFFNFYYIYFIYGHLLLNYAHLLVVFV